MATYKTAAERKGEKAARAWLRACDLTNTIQPKPSCPYNWTELCEEWRKGFLTISERRHLSNL